MKPRLSVARCSLLFALLAIITFPALLFADKTTLVRAPSDNKEIITKMLNDFLTYNDDPTQHDRFWAPDLIYTSSAGIVKTKPDIMKGKANEAKAGAAKEPAANYSAENILVRLYGDTASLTFRLVALYPDGKRPTYRNSGMLVRREGRWQVVTWQATKEPSGAK